MNKSAGTAILSRISRHVTKYAFLILPKRKTMVFEGPGTRGDVGKYCREHGYKKALVVTGPHVGKSEIASKLYDGLKDAGIEYIVFDAIRSEPLLSGCEAGSAFGKKEKVDVVIGFGGGSVLDTAKFIGATLTNPKKAVRKFTVLFTTYRHFPILTIPTTAGTGSEVTYGTVITDDKTNNKRTTGGPGFTPEACFLDVETTLDLPARMTAASGMDTLSHVVENYISAVPGKKRRSFCAKAVKDILEFLPIAYQKGSSNPQARAKMMECSKLGGLAIISGGAVYGHALFHAIGGVLHLSHGETCGIVLPEILEFYKTKTPKILASLAAECGFCSPKDSVTEAADKLIQQIKNLREALELPSFIAGLDGQNINEIKREFWVQSLIFPSPASITEKELDTILQRLSQPNLQAS